MFRLIFVIFCLIFISRFTTDSAKLKPAPSKYFKLCKQTDPKLNDCVKTTLRESHDLFVKGIPELDIIALDNLVIPKLEMNQGEGNLKLYFELSNLKIDGLKNFVLTDSSFSSDMKQLNMTMFTPWISMDGDYKINGRILVVPIKGDGQINMNFTNVTTKSFVEFETYRKSEKDYIRVISFKWIVNPENATTHFSNLFNGDKQLSDATHRFLNENSKEAYNTYRDLPEQAFGELFKSMTNRVLSHYTLDEWFPK